MSAPGVQPGDRVVMDTKQLLTLFDQQQRRDVEYSGELRDVTPAVVRYLPRPGWGREGFVLYSQLTAENADRVIAEQTAFFASRGLDFEWKLYGHDRPADLGARLAAHGFVPEEREALLVLDLEDARAGMRQPIRADVRRITEPAQVAEIVAIKDQVWGESHAWLGAELAQELAEPGELTQVYIAYADGLPASTAWIRFHPGTQFASLWGGSTLPAYRRRGLYTALLAVRAQAAIGRGFRFLTVDASPMSRPILEKHGFHFLTWTTPYKWHLTRNAAAAPA